MADKKKPLARSLGEFFGHIVKGIRTDPEHDTRKTTVRRTVEEEKRGDVILRRTTIEEVEMKDAPETASDDGTDGTEGTEDRG